MMNQSSNMKNGILSLVTSIFFMTLSHVGVQAQTQLQVVTRAVPTQTIWFPLNEEDMLYNVFQKINAEASSPITTMVSVAISTDNTVIWVGTFNSALSEFCVGNSYIFANISIFSRCLLRYCASIYSYYLLGLKVRSLGRWF
jgi:hypothetical protein